MRGQTLARLKGHWYSVDCWVGQKLGSESRQLDSCFPLHLPLAVLSAAPQSPPGYECL